MKGKVKVYNNWVEMIEPLWQSDPDKWADLVCFSFGVAFGDPRYEMDCRFSDPETQTYWEKTRVISAKDGKIGRIMVK